MSAKQVILVTALWIGTAGFTAVTLAADPPTPIDPARAEALSRKIDELNTQLTKLDRVVEQLRHLRTKELPQLERQMREATENSVLVNKKEQSVQKPPANPAPDAADKAAVAPPQSLEAQLAAMHEHLQQLEVVSQQVTALQAEDLPRLKSELNRLKSGTAVERRLMPVPPTQGRLVINNVSGLTRDVTVNGITYTFAPGSWQVPVQPYQDVMTQFTTGEIPHLWGRHYWKQTDAGPEMRLEFK